MNSLLDIMQIREIYCDLLKNGWYLGLVDGAKSYCHDPQKTYTLYYNHNYILNSYYPVNESLLLTYGLYSDRHQTPAKEQTTTSSLRSSRS